MAMASLNCGLNKFFYLCVQNGFSTYNLKMRTKQELFPVWKCSINVLQLTREKIYPFLIKT